MNLKKKAELHVTHTWLWTSVLLTCYPDRLKTLKVGGRKSEGGRRRKRRKEEGEAW